MSNSMADIVQEIDKAFENDPDIDEVGMVLSSEENIVLVEHKLGISMTILKPLFKYTVTELEKYRNDLRNNELINFDDKIKAICSLSRVILLVKGDFPPALNARKVMIEMDILHAQSEIKFLNVVFSKHPKSPSAWHHRRWCLLRLFEEDDNGYNFSTVVDEEVALCVKMCDIYPRNYYAWNHRLWLVNQMETTQELEEEYNKMTTWLQRHVSDYSSVNHQHQVVLQLIEKVSQSDRNPTGSILKILTKCLSESMHTLYRSGSGGHSSLWGLRRLWIMTLLSVVENTCFKHIETTSLLSRSVKSHSFAVCFRSQSNNYTQEVSSKICNMSNTELQLLQYLVCIQKNLVNHIINTFNNSNGESEKSFIGLNSCLASSENYSKIEMELNLCRFLADGVTHDPAGTSYIEMTEVEGHVKSGADDSIQPAQESNDSEDEVDSTFKMHNARISSLVDQLVEISSPNNGNSLSNVNVVMWLHRFIVEEIIFCGSCISTTSWYASNCWNPEKQKHCALEYLIFFLYHLLFFLKQNADVGSTDTGGMLKDSLCALAKLTCNCHVYQGIGVNVGKMKYILSELECS